MNLALRWRPHEYVRAAWKSHKKIMLISLGAGVLLASAGLFLFDRTSTKLPENIWLPPAVSGNAELEVLYLPTEMHEVNKGQGKMLEFKNNTEFGLSRTWLMAKAGNPRLNPAFCPNLFDLEAVLPGPCEKIGEVHGSPVYTIVRRLPSTSLEIFVNFEDTLVVINTADTGREYVMAILQTYQKLHRSDMQTYLVTARSRVGQINEAHRFAKAQLQKSYESAYTRLPFTPVAPEAVPAGWHQSGQVRIEGLNADQPDKMSTIFTDGKERYIDMVVMKRDGYTLGDTCGPTVRQGDTYLTCGPVPGTGYHLGSIRGQDYYSVVLYRPIGDAMVQAVMTTFSSDESKLVFSEEELNAISSLVLSARPVDKGTLDGSEFQGPGYYPKWE